MTAIVTPEVTRPEVATTRKSWQLLVAGTLALAVGFGSFAGGLFGIWYTWEQAVTQNVTTPADARIPETPVRGPFTMWAQIEIINEHQLANTDGLYFAEMPRLVPQVDESGQAILDEAGEQVMVPNPVRGTWFNATSLTTALSLGILAYGLSAMAIAVGLTLAATGWVFLYIRRRAVLL